MKNLPLVDLKGQYQKIATEVNEAVINTIESGVFIGGDEVRNFQKELEQYLDIPNVIPCANGTDALQIALMALDLEPGDEVITPSFTYIATAEVIALLQLKAVFVDVDDRTFCLRPEEVEKAITPRTKAIIPVHLYGHAAPMEELVSISEKHGIPLIEDTAQAIGSDYTFSDGRSEKLGGIGLMGTTSFFPSKNLGCFGDGGAIFTTDDELAKKLRMIANHGQSKRYYHDMIGCNSRLDAIQAAILRVKLRHLDEYISSRQAAANFYTQSFESIDQVVAPYIAPYSTHGFHQYTIKILDGSREALQEHLSEHGIPSNIYYPVPIHRQKGFEGKYDIKSELTVTDTLTSQVLSLPIHTELDVETLNYITKHIQNFYQK